MTNTEARLNELAQDIALCEYVETFSPLRNQQRDARAYREWAMQEALRLSPVDESITGMSDSDLLAALAT